MRRTDVSLGQGGDGDPSYTDALPPKELAEPITGIVLARPACVRFVTMVWLLTSPARWLRISVRSLTSRRGVVGCREAVETQQTSHCCDIDGIVLNPRIGSQLRSEGMGQGYLKAKLLHDLVASLVVIACLDSQAGWPGGATQGLRKCLSLVVNSSVLLRFALSCEESECSVVLVDIGAEVTRACTSSVKHAIASSETLDSARPR